MRRIIELKPERSAGPDLRRSPLASIQSAKCPHCAHSLVSLAARDLHEIRLLWRCWPGKEPRSFELVCPRCSSFFVIHLSDHSIHFATGAEAKRQHQEAQGRSRENQEEDTARKRG